MIRNYFKIAWRNIVKNRIYSAINIVGLSIGITCMLFAVLYWNNEHSFDNFHKNNPNLYRVTTTIAENKGEQTKTTGGTGQVQGPAFKETVPEVKSYVRILGGDIYSDVIANNKAIHLRPLFVDENFLDVFNFHLLRGNATIVLNDLSSVVITESTAKKFFNTIDVVGKLLQLDADPSYNKLGKPLIVSGVVQDPPANSSLQFDVLFTFKFLQLSFPDNNWLNSYLGTFVVLNPKSDIKAVAQKFNSVYLLRAKEQLAENAKTYGFNPQISYGLQPVTDIHLNPLIRSSGNAEGGIINESSPVYSFIFMGIAVFILLMAAINFINISIANSLQRAKEVGIRKISCSSKRQIVAQFLYESAILCFVAFLFSLFLMNFTLPLFNRLAGKQIILSTAFDAKLLCCLVLLFAVIIFLTGLYPAFVLSKFKPSQVLYNKQKLTGRNLLGRSLVVVQFSLAVFLLIATFIFYRQMNYIRTKDLGYNAAQVIRMSVGGDRDYNSVITFIKNEVAKERSIKIISFGNEGYNTDARVNNQHLKTQYKRIDENFLAVLDIPLKAGRNFSMSFSSDTKNGAIVNEAFVKAAGLHNPIGSAIKIAGDENETKAIVGVVKDFHYGSLREPIAPLVMYMTEVPDGGIWIRFDKAKQKEALAAIEKIAKAAIPAAAFQFAFLDELNAKQYVQEQRWQQVVGIASVLSFVICCLGLLGLAHLAAHQRAKEIGVRKVLGASVAQIVTLISHDFLKLVAVAFVIGASVSWIVMNRWLQEFAYRTIFNWWIFIIAGATVIFIASVTVSFQALKAALANPVKSLRTE